MGLMSSVAHAVGVASGIRTGVNPEYTKEMFREIMPAFTAEVLPDAYSGAKKLCKAGTCICHYDCGKENLSSVSHLSR